MKKTFKLKSAMALAMALCIMVASIPATALVTAVGDNEEKDAAFNADEDIALSVAADAGVNLDLDVDGDGKLDYVSLGASNVNGYGLQGYLPEDVTAENKWTKNVYGYRRCADGSYPDLVRDHYEAQGISVDMHQLAISSMRAEELRYLLDDSYAGDAYTKWRFTGGASWFIQATGSLEATKSDYRNSIANADLITLDIGVNNFGVYLCNEITNPNWLGHDVTGLDSEYVEYYEQIRDWLIAKIPEAANYEDALDTVAYAYLGFISGFDGSVEKIRELNPDANIVVVPIQNIIPDLKIDMDGTIIDVGSLVSELTNAANIYTAHISPYHNEYYYASSVRENGKARVEFYIDLIAEYNGDLDAYGADKANILDCFNLYDSSISVVTELQKIFAANYAEELAAAGMTVAQFVAAGEAGLLPSEYMDAYNTYVTALNATYDAFAQIMKVGASYDTIDIEGYSSGGKKVLEAMSEILVEVATTGAEVPENLAEYIAQSKGISEEAVISVLALGVRADIGNSFFGHPTLGGHGEVADAVIYAIENEVTGINFATDYAGGLGKKIIELYQLADSLGYTDMVKEEVGKVIREYIDDAKNVAFDVIDDVADGAIDYLDENKDDIAVCVDKTKDVLGILIDKLGKFVK